jgi:hypothetical protein
MLKPASPIVRRARWVMLCRRRMKAVRPIHTANTGSCGDEQPCIRRCTPPFDNNADEDAHSDTMLFLPVLIGSAHSGLSHHSVSEYVSPVEFYTAASGPVQARHPTPDSGRAPTLRPAGDSFVEMRGHTKNLTSSMSAGCLLVIHGSPASDPALNFFADNINRFGNATHLEKCAAGTGRTVFVMRIMSAHVCEHDSARVSTTTDAAPQ